MKRALMTCLLAGLVGASSALAVEPGVVHHQVAVKLDPADHSLQVRDRLSLGGSVTPHEDGTYRFVLHAGLAPEVLTDGWRLQPTGVEVTADFFGINATTETVHSTVPLEGWRLLPPEDAGGEVELAYGGKIHHPLATQGEEYQRSFSETPGLIGEEGIFLSGTSFWVPTFGDQLLSFELEVSGLKPPWDVVSQGLRCHHETDAEGVRTTAWTLEHPTEEIYLVAGPWHEYSETAGKVKVFAFLRSEDPGLAERYLTATRRYLKMYESMLPSFPYASFSLVENFWETGYGMPGFTLLGPQVIRFPWILSSSYPHELLHNWWGNSAYVDFERGNWCEGLTAYMADHLFAEQRGDAASYRRSTLKKYTDFVSAGSDLPLVEFSSRRSAATEAVGYGKSLMLFHMVRRAVGDEAFLGALSAFYEKHRFERVSFAEIADAFAEVSHGEWGPFFEAWTTRTGAPSLRITNLEVREIGSRENPWLVQLRLEQVQAEEPFPISVPVAVTLEGRDQAMWAEVGSCSSSCAIAIPCPARPLRVDVDPAFDVMRRLDPLEVPPSLSTLLGADDVLYVLPAAATDEERAAWRELAVQWAAPEQVRTVLDTELADLPDGPAWLLGWQNRFAAAVAESVAAHGVEVDGVGFTLAGDRLDRAGHSLILVGRGATDATTAVGWVAADPLAAVAGLARKLPHYSKYSALAFAGDEPTNVVKAVWTPISSPLSRTLVEQRAVGLELPETKPLAELPPAFDASALLATASVLAHPALEGRGLGSEGLARATAWVEEEMRKAGLDPAGDEGFRQTWRWRGGDPEREMELVNLVARAPGSDDGLAEEPILVVAHIDHLGRGWPDVRAGNAGEIHPGADDNASGVAVLLELARTVAREARRARPVLFAVVTGEEAGLLGSRHLLESMADDLPFACLNLDTVGRLADGKLYVLNADSAREWRFIFMGVGYTTGAPVAVVAEPLDASDQMACIERGVPAVQLFTGPTEDYHRPSDIVDKLDGEGMVVVTTAAHEALAYLADRVEPLTVTLTGGTEAAGGGHPGSGGHPGGGGARRVSLGTMPDFAFAGPGVRVQQVMDGSAAAAAGIQAGDVVVAIDGEDISDLRSYSGALKAREAGDTVQVTVLRDDEKLTFGAVLTAR